MSSGKTSAASAGGGGGRLTITDSGRVSIDRYNNWASADIVASDAVLIDSETILYPGESTRISGGGASGTLTFSEAGTTLTINKNSTGSLSCAYVGLKFA